MEKPKFAAELPDELYPKLNSEQIARLSLVGTRRSIPAGEILFDQGTIGRHFYVVLEGAIQAVLPSSEGEVHLRLHQPGDFTGELDMLSGRPSLVLARTLDPTEVIEIDPVSLRNLVQTDPGLGEFLFPVRESKITWDFHWEFRGRTSPVARSCKPRNSERKLPLPVGRRP
jgi:thioredoxin reductase (NADPH)